MKLSGREGIHPSLPFYLSYKPLLHMKNLFTASIIALLFTGCKCGHKLESMPSKVTPEYIIQHLNNGKPKKVVVDSDTFNEMDDQYAVAYALNCPMIELQAINAAPFHNDNSSSYGDGMKKSFQEINRVLKICGKEGEYPVYKGSAERIGDQPDFKPVESVAAKKLIELAHKSEDLIYVLTLGAVTNVASAVLMDESIKDKIVVVWLGTNFADAGHQGEFNLVQDYRAGQVLLNSGVPLILLPASGQDNKGTQVLSVDQEEVKVMKSNSEAARFFRNDLPRSFKKTTGNWWHILWDIAAPGLISKPDAYELEVIPSPVLTEERVLVEDHTRHKIIRMKRVDPKAIRADAFRCIDGL